MITGEFAAVLDELGKILEISDLTPDENNSCLIRLPGDIRVQIEMNRDEKTLIIGHTFDQLPPGKYRENLFEAALKANGLPQPLYGIFSFSDRTDQLFLYDRLPIKNLRGQQVADFLIRFIEKVKTWEKALKNEEVPLIREMTTSRRLGSGPFGLRP